MDDFLSPIGGRNPNNHIMDNSKAGPQQQFEEGTEQIPLPSKGVFYYPPFRNVEEINIRPIDFRDEDILTTERYIEDGTVFDKLIDNVIQDNFSAGNLVPIDRDTILLWLRSTAFGSKMEVPYKCQVPLCNHKNVAKWDLSTFKIPEYEPDVFEQLKENGYYRVITPRTNIAVHLTIPTTGMSKDTEKRFKAQKSVEEDQNNTLSLTLIVVGVELENGKVLRNKKEIFEYFKQVKLPITDSRYLITQAKKLNLKYDTKQDLKCSKCGHVQEGVEMPIVHQNFLWANGDGQDSSTEGA